MKRPSIWLSLVCAFGLAACGRAPSHASSAQPGTAQSASSSASAASESSESSTSAAAQSSAAPPTAQPSSGAAQPGSATGSLEHLAPMPASEQLPQNAEWKPGVNYNVISPAQPTSVAPGKVEVLEVFWLGCPHCYAFEPYIQAWLKVKPAYIQFVRVPVMWGPVHRLHARLFYTLETLGRDDLVEKAFDTIHNDGNPLIGDSDQDTFAMQLKWAQANGLSAAAFRKAYNSFEVQTDLEHAQDVTDRYHVTGVPDVIVAGKYETDVGKAGSHAQLIKLIDFLAAYEHRHDKKG